MLGDLLSLGLVAAGSEILSLMVQGKYYNDLQATINIDIEMPENFIAHLQALLSSVAEVDYTTNVVWTSYSYSKVGYVKLLEKNLFLC